MDWTSTSLQWDWETLLPSNGKDAEDSKFAQQPQWRVDGNSYQYQNRPVSSFSGGGCSDSELGCGSSRSSISVSIVSTSKAGTKTPECSFKTLELSTENIGENKDFSRLDSKVLHGLAASEGPKEPLIGLKLGKRTYFEDVCGENYITITNSSSLASMNLSNGLVKKAKVSQQNMQSSYCQVEGCNVDLTSAKDYHRKHRVCENHSKSPRVIVAGQERRFCQQCSRFHDLSEFDQKKRSCRRRLSDHNARRRKPQPETISCNPAIFAAPDYDETEPTNLIFGQAPFGQMSNMGSSTWDDDSGGFKLIPTKGSWVNSSKLGGVNGHPHLPCIGISKNISTVRHDSAQLLSFKGTDAKVLDQGRRAPVVASCMNGASDLRRALSLLSTESWAASNLEPVSDLQFVNETTIASPHPATHPTNAATGIWQQDHLSLPLHLSLPESYSLPLNLQSNAGQLQEFQLNKAPNAAIFFDSSQIH